MADGIILFGGYALTEEEFIQIFRQWYAQKKQSLSSQLDDILNDLRKMVVVEQVQYKSGRVVDRVQSRHGAAVRTGEYNANKILEKWEKLSQELFGNPSVEVMAITRFENKTLQWSTLIPEHSITQKSGIAVRKKQLKALIKDELETQNNVYAAQDVQSFLSKHYDDLVNTLQNTNLTWEQKQALNNLLKARNSTIKLPDFNTDFGYSVLFETQKNSEGKIMDAFMNHVGKYNNALFAAMKMKKIEAKSLSNISLNYHSFGEILAQADAAEWLLDSLNSASWMTGGDIIVVDGKTGKVLYNIQLKATSRGKTFELATSNLFTFAYEVRRLINDDSDADNIAKVIFAQLKTSTANEFKRAENFLESEAYNMISQSLGLT